VDEERFLTELLVTPRLMTRHDPRFAVFNRMVFLSQHGLTEEEGEALDRVVQQAGGRVRLIAPPPRRSVPVRRQASDPPTLAWDVPLEWLRGGDSIGTDP